MYKLCSVIILIVLIISCSNKNKTELEDTYSNYNINENESIKKGLKEYTKSKMIHELNNKNIIELLCYKKYDITFRKHENNNNYYGGTLVYKENELNLIYESSGAQIGIIGYSYNNDELQFIWDFKWFGAEVVEPDTVLEAGFMKAIITKNEIYDFILNSKRDIWLGNIQYEDITNIEELNRFISKLKNKPVGKVEYLAVPLYEKPNLDSNIILKLEKNTTVKVLSISDKKQLIDNKKSFWFKVETIKNDIGWVFGYYIGLKDSIKFP